MGVRHFWSEIWLCRFLAEGPWAVGLQAACVFYHLLSGTTMSSFQPGLEIVCGQHLVQYLALSSCSVNVSVVVVIITLPSFVPSAQGRS